MLSVIMLNVIGLRVTMLNSKRYCVTYNYAEYHYAECHYAECHCAGCHGTEQRLPSRSYFPCPSLYIGFLIQSMPCSVEFGNLATTKLKNKFFQK